MHMPRQAPLTVNPWKPPPDSRDPDDVRSIETPDGRKISPREQRELYQKNADRDAYNAACNNGDGKAWRLRHQRKMEIAQHEKRIRQLRGE
jgi:hypothetical protein